MENHDNAARRYAADTPASTTSSISGLYRSLLQTPAPICMFYVSQPLGVATPVQHALTYRRHVARQPSMSSASSSRFDESLMPHQQQQHQSSHQHNNMHEHHHLQPMQWQPDGQRSAAGELSMPSWNTECMVPPLVQFLASHIGHSVPDLETLIQHIREAWNSPNCRAVLQSVSRPTPTKPPPPAQYHQLPQPQQQHFQQHYQHPHEQPPAAIRAGHPHIGVATTKPTHHNHHHHHQQTHHHITAADAATAAAAIIMGSGSYCNLAGGPGLLRRRYSMPEIIMRKHSLSQQKALEEAAALNNNNNTDAAGASGTAASQWSSTSAAGGPPTTNAPSTRPPAPHRPPRNSTGQQYPNTSLDHNSNYSPYDSPPLHPASPLSTAPYSPQYSQQSVAYGGRHQSHPLSPHNAPGGGPAPETSMRRQLLRRIWSKEFRQASETRSGSWSPPLRRSHRRLTVADPPPVQCAECSKLELEFGGSNVSLPTALVAGATTTAAAQRRLRLAGGSTMTATSSTMTVDGDGTEERRADSVERNDNENNNNHNNNVEINDADATREESSNHPYDFGRNETTTTTSTTDTNSNVISANKDTNSIDQYVAKVLLDSLNNVRTENAEISFHSTANNNIDTATSEPPPLTSATTTIMYVTNITTHHPDTGSAIYFPRYSGESTANQSVDDDDDIALFRTPNTEDDTTTIVSVQSGSTYPETAVGHGPYTSATTTTLAATVSRKLSQRTESMEAQRASSSPSDERDGAESDGSLVDSLDDPQSPRPDAREQQPVVYEKSQTFFVPMTDDRLEQTDGVSAAMPEKLRERLERRLHELDAKKQHHHHYDNYHHQFDDVTQRKGKKRVSKRQRNNTDSSDAAVDVAAHQAEAQPSSSQRAHKPNDESAAPSTTITGGVGTQKPSKSKKYIRAEVGLLETYTIDARGNLQFHAPTVEKSRGAAHKSSTTRYTSTTTTTTATASSKRSVATTVIAPSVIRKPYRLRKTIVAGGESAIVKRATKKSSSNGGNVMNASNGNANGAGANRRSQHRRSTDVQHMTLYAAAPSELMTPDVECGPRRMYQKTEIVDGEKRIEILEIVECLEETTTASGSGNSSGSNSASPTSETNNARTHQRKSPTPPRPSASTRRSSSRIPIPIFRMGTPSGFQKAVRCSGANRSGSTAVDGCSAAASSSLAGRIFVRSGGSATSANSPSKVDQMIADLLIEALNHPKELGIEIVQSPRLFGRSGGSRKSGSTATTAAGRTGSSGSGLSGKFQRMFEAIPEEKGAGSMSVDSSATDETQVPASRDEHEQRVNDEDEEKTTTTTTTTTTSNGTRNGPREAIVNGDRNAWIGFFKQHDESLAAHDDEANVHHEENSTAATTTITTPATATTIEHLPEKPATPPLPSTPPPIPSLPDSLLAAPSTTQSTEPDSNRLALVPITPLSPPPPSSSLTTFSPSSPLMTAILMTTTTPTTASTSFAIPSPIVCASAAILSHHPHHHLQHARFAPTIIGHCEECRLIDIELMGRRSPLVTMPPRSILSTATSQLTMTPWPQPLTDNDDEEPEEADCNEQPPSSYDSSAYGHCGGTAAGVSVKPALSPIESVSQKSGGSSPDAIIDGSSFIVLRDDDLALGSRDDVEPNGETEKQTDDVAAEGSVVVSVVSAAGREQETAIPTPATPSAVPTTGSPQARCDDCCFCNPELHKRSRSISRNCSYCNRKRSKSMANETSAARPRPAQLEPPTPITPSASNASFNTTTTTNTAGNFYETLSKSDHTHIRTRSKHKDSVRLQCTRTNSKIRRFVPAPSDSGAGTAPQSSSAAAHQHYPHPNFPDPDDRAQQHNHSNAHNHHHHTASSSAPTTKFRFPPATNNNNNGTTSKPPPHSHPFNADAVDAAASSPRPHRSRFRSQPVRLPSPFVNPNSSTASSAQHSQDDGNSSSTSCSSSSAGHSPQCSTSSSFGSGPSSPCKQQRLPPVVSRWQQQHQPDEHHKQHNNHNRTSSKNHQSTIDNKLLNNNLAAETSAIMRPSRYQNFYGNGADAAAGKEDNCNRNNGTAAAVTTTSQQQQLSGWSLTLAGTYRDDMAPDVEMRLSFPKKPTPTGHNNALPEPIVEQLERTTAQQLQQALTMGEQQQHHRLRQRQRGLEQSVSSERTFIAANGNNHHSNSNNNNNNNNNGTMFYDNFGRDGGRQSTVGDGGDSNDNLMSASRSSNVIGGCGAASSVDKTMIKPQLPMNPKRTLMAKACTARGNRANSTLPDVTMPTPFDRDLIARNTIRKTIKRSEYSVAVASATTKTISNYGPGKRAMSYQTLNANSIRIDNHHHHHHNHQRDRSVDLGNISGRRMSADSGQPTSSVDGMALSVLGNAIAPEQKPRVPTQSERDLTRRTSNACFTRSRGLFS